MEIMFKKNRSLYEIKITLLITAFDMFRKQASDEQKRDNVSFYKERLAEFFIINACEDQRCVSGSPTLPRFLPRPLTFYCELQQNYFELGDIFVRITIK